MIWNNILSSKRLRGTERTIILDSRNEFESDYGRIVFSPAIRRMHDKTQVFPLNSDDNIHTRLTHSMEVQAIANSLGLDICSNKDIASTINYSQIDLFRTVPVILSSIALCHDIGNPPFGHYGEEVISNYFIEFFKKNKKLRLKKEEKKDFTLFNGNAQGFRVLTKLQVLQDNFGLNLTIGTLSSYLKYPVLSNEINSDIRYQKKLGVFQSEKDKLKVIRETTGLCKIRNPLVFLMEAADDICFLTMDIEDGYNKKYYSISDICYYLKENGDSFIINQIETFEKKEFKEINVGPTKMVNLRILLIRLLINHAYQTFTEKLNSITDGSYTKELIYDNFLLSDLLVNFTKKNVLAHREILSLELTGESVLKGLLDVFIYGLVDINGSSLRDSKRAHKLFGLISNSFKAAIFYDTGQIDLDNLSNFNKLHLIVDFISGMTDNYALSLYQQLKGITT